MCGRYYIDEAMVQEVEELLQTFCCRHPANLPGAVHRSGIHTRGIYPGDVHAGDIHPGDRAPVLVRTMDGICLVQQSWGIPVPEVHGRGLIFNARSERVLEKRMFQDGVRHRRAVIPARWFYEWNRAKEKITFLQEKGDILYLAGFFNQYEDGSHFVVLTTEANDSMKATHDRMPLLLNQSEIQEWLEGSEKNDVSQRLLKKKPEKLDKRAEYEQLSFYPFL